MGKPAEKFNNYSKGQKVKIRVGREWVDGTISSFDSTGYPVVRHGGETSTIRNLNSIR